MKRTITIKGVGKAAVKPDYVVVSLSLQTQEMDYWETMATAAVGLRQIKESLDSVGFLPEDLKTKDFAVDTKYSSIKTEKGDYQRVFLGFACLHRLEISFDFCTDRLAETLNALARCPASPEFSVSFTIKDSEAVNELLLQRATEVARKKAEILCRASQVKLGALLVINYDWKELNVFSHTDLGLGIAGPQRLEHKLDLDIEPDEVNLRDTATFIWEII